MAVDPSALDNPERGGQVRRNRDGKSPSTAEDLTRIVNRMSDLGTLTAIGKLKGARDHCFDCFQRGVKAAIAALREQDDDDRAT